MHVIAVLKYVLLHASFRNIAQLTPSQVRVKLFGLLFIVVVLPSVETDLRFQKLNSGI